MKVYILLSRTAIIIVPKIQLMKPQATIRMSYYFMIISNISFISQISHPLKRVTCAQKIAHRMHVDKLPRVTKQRQCRDTEAKRSSSLRKP